MVFSDVYYYAYLVGMMRNATLLSVVKDLSSFIKTSPEMNM